MPESHPDPPPVPASAVLAALAEVRRRGQWPLLQDLEHVEPDLTNFILEELSLTHATLLKARATPKGTRLVQRQVQSLVLVCVLALRDSRGDHARLGPPSTAEPDGP